MGRTTELHPPTGLVFDRVGSGAPLVLVHGIGADRGIWERVVPRLARTRDLVLVDLPGFGETPPLPEDVEPSPGTFADLIAHLIVDLGLRRPHVGGHSLGGWVALEVAARGEASSVTALAPAGLWADDLPATVRVGLSAMRVASRRLRPLVPLASRSPLVRTAVLWPQSGRPWAVGAADVATAVESFASNTGFERTLRAMAGRHFTGRAGLDVPVTAAFGSRDLIIDRWQAQHRDLLPASARWVPIPGAGHVPQWDAPDATARILLEGSTGPLRLGRHPRAGKSY